MWRPGFLVKSLIHKICHNCGTKNILIWTSDLWLAIKRTYMTSKILDIVDIMKILFRFIINFLDYASFGGIFMLDLDSCILLPNNSLILIFISLLPFKTKNRSIKFWTGTACLDLFIFAKTHILKWKRKLLAPGKAWETGHLWSHMYIFKTI